MDRERHNWKTNTSQDDIESSTTGHDASETDPTPSIDTQSNDVDQASKHIDHLINLNLKYLNEKDTSTVDDNSKQMITTVSEKRDTCPEVMRLFSENILKSLLAQIRFPKLVLSDVLRTMKTELGNNYIDFLLDETYFSKSSEPRRKYKEQSSEATRVINNNVTKIFQIKSINWETMPYSEEEYLLGDLKWKICLKWTLNNNTGKDIYTMYLKCTSDNNQNDWKCTVECQVKWISHDSRYNLSLKLPDDYSYTTLTLTGGMMRR
uniref:MATH domain-containing protein n=1 Tax=Cacopsylla melanoneura TaxID=428564 RepID=A0A8D8RVJ2_9HEMI